LRVGVFHPTLNMYGGAELVALVVTNTLAKNGYEVELFVNKRVNQKEIKKKLGEEIHSTVKIIAKPSFIQPRDSLDLYQTIFRSFTFKSKCDVWIDTYSNCIFPWTNICYIHFPFFNHTFFNPRFPYLKSRHLYHVSGIPYVLFGKNIVNSDGKLILANSNLTAHEIRKFSRTNAEVLYPPVPSTFFDNNPKNLVKGQRKNLVVTVSRFGPDKGLEKVPYIASLTDDKINFALIGLVSDKNVLLSIQEDVKKLRLTGRVKFLPNISKRDIKLILKNAKIYLHTMVGEHFGISIVEAMAMGCIPIVHDSGGAREFVPRNFRYKNIYDAAEKIRKGIYEWSPSKAMEIVKIAERFREKNFSNRFIKLFENYVAAK